MNENSTNTRENCKVISKYFASSPVMDESLSDFKEKKTGYTGPKNSQKPAVSKGKTKKAPKRIRGQKDIRTALKPKKNELLAYAKEFNEVCRKSGIDVDAEQLQLAIALSKSVQSEENECSSIQSGQSLTSQERTGRIRTTLKEYGFVVPEVKIASNKRKKKLRKNYKLILTSEEEKKQIISDKYANILFENVDIRKVISNNIDVTDKRLYYLATSIPYVDLKNNDVLYVQNLVERSSSNGSLLRDWSDIPGRPQSPKPNKEDSMDFSEIECSQEELDVVLSGTIKSTKNIMNNKANVHNAPQVLVDSCDNNETISPRTSEDKTVQKSFEEYADDCSIAKEKCSANDNTNFNNSFLNTLDRVRSCSPDIFDEEVSAVCEYSNNSLSENCKTPSKENIEMDLTKDDCNKKYTDVNMSTTKYNNNEKAEVNDVILDEIKSDFNQEIKSNAGPKINDILKADLEVTSHLAQTSNYTKRNSNDFMEITECVVVSSEVDSNVYSLHKSNLSQIKNKTRRMTNDLMEITVCVDKPYSDHIEENIDLTQNSDENKDVTAVNVIVNNASEKVIDISQSSHSEDELPFVQMSGCNKSSLDDTILLDSEEIIINYNPIKSVSNTNIVALDEDQEVTENINLTETPLKKTKNDSSDKLASQSFFDEFIHNHSDDANNENSVSSSHNQEYSKVNDIEIDLTQPNFKTSDIYDEEEVDLTQSSNSFDAKESNKSVNTPEKSSLGKKDEVSIDYDEMFDDITRSSIVTNSKIGNSSKDTVTYDITDYGDGSVLENQSQNSEKFNISDKEFEYSLNKSRNDFAMDVNFGGISIMENVSCENKTTGRTERDSLDNRTMSDSYLPIVNIRKDLPLVDKRDINKIKSKDVGEDGNKKTFEGNGFSSCNIKENAFTTDTPSNNKYIVKTDQVTPMLDYGAMSTPERNRELDKYGLKPFKRKRAVQLLTHLYNQTHPLVEACPEDLPSSSKKKRYSSQPSPIKPLESPNKFMKSPSKSQKSPRKLLKSPHKPLKSPKEFSQNELQSADINEDSNLYEVTNELPDIKDIACSEEDWIFQKREKAKVHSCRVPLHIALHNYVTCRRRLREAILKYEPVNIDFIHKELVASGHRYDPKDLLKYMDKKCITVKTADNNARNNRR